MHSPRSVVSLWQVEAPPLVSAHLTVLPEGGPTMSTGHTILPDTIARGALPHAPHDRTSLSLGNGQLCDGCDKAVLGADTEVAVGFAHGLALRFHVDCFGVWHVAARAATGQAGELTSTRRPAAPRVQQ